MHVRLLVFWWIKVHNTVDSVDVDSARSNISANKNLKSLGLEGLKRLVTLSL